MTAALEATLSSGISCSFLFFRFLSDICVCVDNAIRQQAQAFMEQAAEHALVRVLLFFFDVLCGKTGRV